MIRKHLEYAKYVGKHKWYVLLECIRLRIPLLGLLHDWSKLLPSEWLPYAEFFYGKRAKPVRDRTGYYKPTDTGDEAFDFAWLLHQKRNKHHWQWWVLPEDSGGLKVLDMPMRYRREMLADWYGAAQAQGKARESVKGWYEANQGKMRLAPPVRQWLEEQLRPEQLEKELEEEDGQ